MNLLCIYMSRDHQTHQDPLRNHVLKTISVFGNPAEVGHVVIVGVLLLSLTGWDGLNAQKIHPCKI